MKGSAAEPSQWPQREFDLNPEEVRITVLAWLKVDGTEIRLIIYDIVSPNRPQKFYGADS